MACGELTGWFCGTDAAVEFALSNTTVAIAEVFVVCTQAGKRTVSITRIGVRQPGIPAVTRFEQS